MKLDVEVGLGHGHIVLDEHLAPTPQIFGPCLFWPNGWLDQNATWPRRHCVRWGPITPKRGDISPPLFWPMFCGQIARWITMPLGTELGLGPHHIVLHEDLAAPQKRGHSPPPKFSARVFCGQMVAHLSYC